MPARVRSSGPPRLDLSLGHCLGLCVLGCRSDSLTLKRRAEAGAATYLALAAGAAARPPAVVVACGGRAWEGRVEADELARMMVEEGVPADALVRERCSLDTRDNARFAASLLARRDVSQVVLVSCSWHLPRAERLFRAAGLDVVDTVGVDPLNPTRFRQLYWRAREHLSSWHDARRKVSIV